MINIKKTLYRSMLIEIKYQLKPLELVINNVSEMHKGHVGYNNRGETHFEIFIVSGLFENMNRIERHRMVYKALSGDNFKSIHSISIYSRSLSEYN